MQDQPSVDNLLATARESVLERILPALSGDLRLEALMVANALAICRRAAAAGDTPLRAEFAALCGFYGALPETAPRGVALETAVRELNTRLARDIRAGVFDARDTKHAAVAEFLREMTLQKLRESNPKMLKLEGLEP